jgi:hypothetical protein
MRGPSRVAVLGGYGAVGRATARLLGDLGVTEVRIGGRRLKDARAVVDQDLRGAGEAMAVDLWDIDSLAAFCASSRVVVNCAGPSYKVLDRVARAAFAAGADYVDPGGDTPVYRRLTSPDLPARGRAAVLNAGLMPGLTSILPRWLARQFSRPSALRAYVGVIDRLTPGSAAEYLLTLGGEHGEAQARWCNGSRISRALAPQSGVRLPFFPTVVNTYPYLSLETERLARTLKLETVDWYNVFDGGGHMLAALGRLQGAMNGSSDLDAAALQLCAAAELDLFGRQPYQVLLVLLDGEIGHTQQTRALVLCGTDTYELTGAVAAFATRMILDGRVPPGVRYAEAALPSDAVVEWLQKVPALATLETLDTGVDVDAVEEGEL